MCGPSLWGPRPAGRCSERAEDQQQVALMFRARPAGPASAIDQPVSASRRERRRDATGRGFAMGRGLITPFDGVFSFHNPRAAIAVNWGITAIVYSLAGGLIARPSGATRPWRSPLLATHKSRGSHDRPEHRQGQRTREGSCRRADRDRHLKNEGRVDQAKSSVKNDVDKVADTLAGVADSPHGPQQNQAVEPRMREPSN